jgi:hypothetical protein
MADNQIFGNKSKSYLEQLVRQGNNAPQALSYQKLTVAGTAVLLTVPATATYCEIEVESSITGRAVRYLSLGASSLPTSTDGLSGRDGDKFDILTYSNMLNFRAIQVAGGTHTLHIQYYK